NLGAEAAHELSELDAGRAAAEDDDALGDLPEGGRFAIGPVAGVRESGNRWDLGVAAGRDHDPRGLERLVADLHATGTRERGRALVDANAALLPAVDLGRVVEVADHPVAVVGHLRPALLRRGGAGRALRL